MTKAGQRSMFVRRDAAGLCRDCGAAREGEGATAHRCGVCATRVARGKRARRLLMQLAAEFGYLAEMAQATRPPGRLRRKRRGRVRRFRTEDGRLLDHERLLLALIQHYLVHVKG